MKKLSLILALILVVSCVLVACSSEEDASSAPVTESSVADTESAAESTGESTEGSVEASEDTAESTAESTDESTPADESSTEDVPAGGNVALNKSYTISGNGKPGAQYTANLTDGVAGEDTSAYDDTWFAFYANPTMDPSQLNAAEGKGYVIIDLGETKNLSKIRIHCGNNMPSGVPSPAWFDCKVSDSDALDSFTYMCEIPRQDSQQSEYATCAYWTEADISGFAGRYVQINVTVNGTWCWINEIEIYEAAE